MISLHKSLGKSNRAQYSLSTVKKGGRVNDVCVFYRYARVRNFFNDLIAEKIVDQRLINSKDDIFDISQRGGGIDRKRLKNLFSQFLDTDPLFLRY